MKLPNDRNGPPAFGEAFAAQFSDLLRWRRDVRRFRRDPVPEELFQKIIHLASLAPSVGYSQPWRFLRVQSSHARSAVRENFLKCNQEALNSYQDERASLYAKLKLAGLDEAPEHLAVFCDSGTETGKGLGIRTMPEMLEYSAVIAVHTLWLAARVYDLGLGWVSILDPREINRILEVPDAWRLIAYLCIGYPEEEHTDPELERHHWEHYRQPQLLLK